MNPFGPVATAGACLVCGEPIAYKIRGRPRLYCESVRCRRRGARKRAQAAAWEEGQAAEVPAVATALPGPTYENGFRDGQEAGRAEAVRLVRLLADKGDAFFLSKERTRTEFLALEQAIRLARRWLDGSA